jgi:hypothetical protein
MYYLLARVYLYVKVAYITSYTYKCIKKAVFKPK